jgi:hypothetical protein
MIFLIAFSIQPSLFQATPARAAGLPFRVKSGMQIRHDRSVSLCYFGNDKKGNARRRDLCRASGLMILAVRFNAR